MTIALTILRNTPWFVFVLFAVILTFGLQALQSRVVPVWRLVVTPAAFIAWGLSSLALQSVASPILWGDWLAAAVVGAAVAWMTTRLDDVRIDRARQIVSLPGSTVTLIRNLAIFSVKYALGVAIALAPAWHAALVDWDVAVSGAAAGYFLGWLARFLSSYRRASPPHLVSSPQT